MPSCAEQYFQDVAACDATYNQAAVVCYTLPTEPEQIACLQQAQAARQECEQKAYLKYVHCLGQQGSSLPAGCGCGNGGE